MPEMKNMIFKKTKIRVDENGLVSLSDIHIAAGFTKNQTPSDWIGLTGTQRQVAALIKKKTGKSGLFAPEDIKAAWYTKKGPEGGVWADENLALGYAAYLSPILAVEIREVFLRYKKGDATLHSEIRENARRHVDEARERHRIIGKQVRKDYTATLKDHGVEKPFDYANCTNEVYKPILGGTASQIKTARGLPKRVNLRDHMTTSELAFAMAAEALATERIEQARSDGYVECRDETKFAATSIGSAIDTDRKNRQKKLL